MPTASQQRETTAFRANAASYAANPRQAAVRQPLRTQPAPQPASRPLAKPRQKAQTRNIAFLMLMAFLLLVMGFAYLTCCAQVTREGYRRVQLREALKRERAMAQQWKQAEALQNNPAEIGKRARALGMTRPNEQDTVVLQ